MDRMERAVGTTPVRGGPRVRDKGKCREYHKSRACDSETRMGAHQTRNLVSCPPGSERNRCRDQNRPGVSSGCRTSGIGSGKERVTCMALLSPLIIDISREERSRRSSYPWPLQRSVKSHLTFWREKTHSTLMRVGTRRRMEDDSSQNGRPVGNSPAIFYRFCTCISNERWITSSLIAIYLGLAGTPAVALPGDGHWDRQFNMPGTATRNIALGFNGNLLYTGGYSLSAGQIATNTVVNIFDGTNWTTIGE